MIFDEDRNVFRLDAGKEFHANGGIIGLEVHGRTRNVYGGYDDRITNECGGIESWNDDDKVLTADELAEVANFMIEAWTDWRDSMLNK